MIIARPSEARDLVAYRQTIPACPNGYEFCINMAAVDSNGNVYVNSEDRNAYEIPQGNTGTFGQDGNLYAQSNGHMIVVRN